MPSIKRKETVRGVAERILSRKRPVTYDQVTEELQRRFPDRAPSRDSVLWYASRMRKSGRSPNVKRKD